MAGLLAGRALAQTQDVGDHAGAFLGEGLRQAESAQEIGLLGELRPQLWTLLVQGIMGGHESQDAAGLQGIEGFRQKEVMQRAARPVVVQAEIGEGTLPRPASIESAGRWVSRKCSIRMS